MWCSFESCIKIEKPRAGKLLAGLELARTTEGWPPDIDGAELNPFGVSRGGQCRPDLQSDPDRIEPTEAANRTTPWNVVPCGQGQREHFNRMGLCYSSQNLPQWMPRQDVGP